MKTFDDFLNEINEADLEEHLETSRCLIASKLSKDDEIIQLCAAQTLALLEQYHEWLCKELQG